MEEEDTTTEKEGSIPNHLCACKVMKLLDHDELEVHRTILSLLPYIKSAARIMSADTVVAELEGPAQHGCPHSYTIGLSWYCANPARQQQRDTEEMQE